jgi:hypothetical protein
MYEKWNEIHPKDTAWIEGQATGLTVEVMKMIVKDSSVCINKLDEGLLSG